MANRLTGKDALRPGLKLVKVVWLSDIDQDSDQECLEVLTLEARSGELLELRFGVDKDGQPIARLIQGGVVTSFRLFPTGGPEEDAQKAEPGDPGTFPCN